MPNSTQRPRARAKGPLPRARREGEPERAGGLDQVELVAVRVGGQAIGEATQQPGRRRTEDAEPEQLDVAAVRVVAGVLDDRVDPRAHDDQRRDRRRDAGRGAGRAVAAPGRGPRIERRFGGTGRGGGRVAQEWSGHVASLGCVGGRCGRGGHGRRGCVHEERWNGKIAGMDEDCRRWTSELAAGPRVGGTVVADRRAHRRRDLHRLGHPRLPRAERGVDPQPGGREGRRRCSTTSATRRCVALVAEAVALDQLRSRAQRRPPRPGRARAAGRLRGDRHPEHRRAAPEGRERARTGHRGARHRCAGRAAGRATTAAR